MRWGRSTSSRALEAAWSHRHVVLSSASFYGGVFLTPSTTVERSPTGFPASDAAWRTQLTCVVSSKLTEEERERKRQTKRERGTEDTKKKFTSG